MQANSLRPPLIAHTPIRPHAYTPSRPYAPRRHREGLPLIVEAGRLVERAPRLGAPGSVRRDGARQLAGRRAPPILPDGEGPASGFTDALGRAVRTRIHSGSDGCGESGRSSCEGSNPSFFPEIRTARTRNAFVHPLSMVRTRKAIPSRRPRASLHDLFRFFSIHPAPPS